MYLSQNTDSIIPGNSNKDNNYPRLHAKHSHAGVAANAMPACEAFACQRAVDSHAGRALPNAIRETGIRCIHHCDCNIIISNNKDVVNYKNIVISTEKRNCISAKTIVFLRCFTGLAQVKDLCLIMFSFFLSFGEVRMG